MKPLRPDSFSVNVLKRKKGIFFLFDSLFAIIVLITGTILVFSTYVSTPNTLLTHAYAVQLLDQLHEVDVQDLTTPYLLNLYRTNEIPDDIREKSLLQLLYYLDETPSLRLHIPHIFNETIGVVLSNQYNLEIYADGSEMYNVTNNLVSEDDARFIIVERRIFLSEYNGTLYGPNVTKVKIW